MRASKASDGLVRSDQLPNVGWTDLRRLPNDPRPPAPLVLGVAFVALLGWVGFANVAGMSPTASVIGAGVIATVAGWWLTIPAAACMALVAFLVVDGFVQGRFGQLSWDGLPDAIVLVGLLVVCALSAELRHDLLVAAARRRRFGVDRQPPP